MNSSEGNEDNHNIQDLHFNILKKDHTIQPNGTTQNLKRIIPEVDDISQG